MSVLPSARFRSKRDFLVLAILERWMKTWTKHSFFSVVKSFKFLFSSYIKHWINNLLVLKKHCMYWDSSISLYLLLHFTYKKRHISNYTLSLLLFQLCKHSKPRANYKTLRLTNMQLQLLKPKKRFQLNALHIIDIRIGGRYINK